MTKDGLTDGEIGVSSDAQSFESGLIPNDSGVGERFIEGLELVEYICLRTRNCQQTLVSQIHYNSSSWAGGKSKYP